MSPEKIAAYAPENAKNLTPEQIEAMQHLTPEELNALAKAHPNKAKGNNYLLIYDSRQPLRKQLSQISTWNNLSNLVNKYGQTFWKAIGFTNNHLKFNEAEEQKIVQSKPVAKAVVVDLTEADLKNAAGVKKEQDPPAEPHQDPPLTIPADNVNNANSSEIQKEIEQIEKELADAVEEKAHHMTIKSIQGRLDAAKAKLVDLTEAQ